MTARDTMLREALNQWTPPQEKYPYDWEDVLSRAAYQRHARSTRRRRNLVVLCLATAAAASLAILVIPWEKGTNIVARAEAALTVPPDEVLHLKYEDIWRDNLGHLQRPLTEVWIDSRGRFHGFTTDLMTGRRVEIGGTNNVHDSVEYDPTTNTIGAALVDGGYYAIPDPVASLRKQLVQGVARADNETTIRGRIVKRITLRVTGLDCKPAITQLFVDPKTYRPIETHATFFIPNRVPAIRRFLVYQQLLATAASRRLTSIRSAHPTAKVAPPPPGAPTGSTLAACPGKK